MNTVFEHINSSGTWFVDFAAPMLLQSIVLVMILLLVDLLLRKKVRAVFRYCMWMLILAKLVLPSSLSSPVGIGNWLGYGLPTIPVAKSPVADNHLVNENLPFVPNARAAQKTSVVKPAFDVSPVRSDIASQTQPAEIAATLTWQGGVFLFWLVVVVAMGLLLLQRAVFVCGLIRQAKEANNLMNDTLRFCCGQMGIKRNVGLKVSANATSPAVCGLFGPVILIPENLGSDFGVAGLRAIILHELAHIKRFDLWVNLLQTILQIIYFYNPFVWLANWIIRRVREQAVDEMVLVTMGEKAQQYPETLINIARLAFKRPALSLRLIGVVESKSALAQRIKHILNRPIPKSAKLGILGLAVILIFAAILLPMAQAEKKNVGIDYSSVTITEGVGFDDIIVGDSNCTKEFIKSKLGQPDDEVRNEKTGWYLNYNKKYGLDFWVNLQENLLLEIRLNKGFNGSLTSGISVSSTKQDVFKVYGQPIKEETARDFDKRFDDQVLLKKKFAFGQYGKIYYNQKGLLFWFVGNKVHQIVVFRKEKQSDAQIDMAIENFDISPYPEGGLYSVCVSIRNKGKSESPGFSVHFYRGDPNHVKPMTHGAGPIKPGDVWNEGSMPFALKEGVNKIIVVLDPTNAVNETDKTNNVAELTVVVKDSKIVEKSQELKPNFKTDVQIRTGEQLSSGAGEESQKMQEIMTMMAQGGGPSKKKMVANDANMMQMTMGPGTGKQYNSEIKEAQEQLIKRGESKKQRYEELLQNRISMDFREWDSNSLTVQYAVLHLCEYVEVPYQFEKSQKLAGEKIKQRIKPGLLSPMPARLAMLHILEPLGLTFGLDENGLYIYQIGDEEGGGGGIQGGNELKTGEELQNPAAQLEVADANSVGKRQPLPSSSYIWGETGDGLRAAVEFLPEKEEYAIGEQIGIRFYIQNDSNRIIQFTTGSWRNDRTTCVAQDSEGNKILSRSILYLGLARIERKILLPGQIVTLESATLYLAADEKQANSTTHPVGNVLILKPGQYSLWYQLDFPDVRSINSKGKVDVPQPGDWQGLLNTGKRRFIVVNQNTLKTPPETKTD